MSDLLLNEGINISESCDLKITKLLEVEMFKFKNVNFHGISFVCPVKYKYLVIDEYLEDLSCCTILIFESKPEKGDTGEWEDNEGNSFVYIANVDLSQESAERIEELTGQTFDI